MSLGGPSADPHRTLGIGALGIIGSGDQDALHLVVPAVAVVGAVVTDEPASILDVVGISVMHAAMFGASAWLFRRSSSSTA